MSVSTQRPTRRWTRRLTVLASVISLILGVVLWESLSPSARDSAAGRVLDLRAQASTVRVLCITVLFIAWPIVIDLAARTFEPRARRLRDARVRVCGWLLVIELLVGQNLLGRALG